MGRINRNIKGKKPYMMNQIRTLKKTDDLSTIKAFL